MSTDTAASTAAEADSDTTPGTEPSRPSGPIVLPGGVQIVGTLLRIPGRTLNVVDAEQLAEAERHATSVIEAVGRLRADFPELD